MRTEELRTNKGEERRSKRERRQTAQDERREEIPVGGEDEKECQTQRSGMTDKRGYFRGSILETR